MSFDTTVNSTEAAVQGSQSLWNRAMSFDDTFGDGWKTKPCLNPFGTGQCLSTWRI